MKYITIIILSVLIVTTLAQTSQLQIDALTYLYTTTNGPSWFRDGNWLIGDPCSNNWEGVVCSGFNIRDLALGGNNLTGILPEANNFHLPSLSRL